MANELFADEDEFLAPLKRNRKRQARSQKLTEQRIDILSRARSLLNTEQYADKKMGSFQKLMSDKNKEEMAEPLGEV